MTDELSELRAEVDRLRTLVESIIDGGRIAALEVEELRVVEPDGTPRLVLASRGSFPRRTQVGGRSLDHPRPVAGILIFNDDGDECGGLISAGGGDGTSGSQEAALSFDRYGGDQVVQLVQEDIGGSRVAGLRVLDQPDMPLADLVERFASVEAMPEGERDASIRRLEVEGLTPSERLFVGRTVDGCAAIRLCDGKGRVRVRLEVSAQGHVVFGAFDEDGNQTWPQASPATPR